MKITESNKVWFSRILIFTLSLSCLLLLFNIPYFITASFWQYFVFIFFSVFQIMLFISYLLKNRILNIEKKYEK